MVGDNIGFVDFLLLLLLKLETATLTQKDNDTGG